MDEHDQRLLQWIESQPGRQVTVRKVQQNLSWVETAEEAMKRLATLFKAGYGDWASVNAEPGTPGPKQHVFRLGSAAVDCTTVSPDTLDVKCAVRTRKFAIAYRDSFTCQFCGSSPGYAEIEIDHLVPVALGGSDSDANLVAACVKCNRHKSDMIVFPAKMCEGRDSLDGMWTVHKSFGKWQVKFCQDTIVLEFTPYGYWIEGQRVHEPDWLSHIQKKCWKPPHDDSDLLHGLEYLRALMKKGDSE